jgi:hypothetical protein
VKTFPGFAFWGGTIFDSRAVTVTLPGIKAASITVTARPDLTGVGEITDNPTHGHLSKKPVLRGEIGDTIGHDTCFHVAADRFLSDLEFNSSIYLSSELPEMMIGMQIAPPHPILMRHRAKKRVVAQCLVRPAEPFHFGKRFS